MIGIFHQKVVDKITELGEEAAADFFKVGRPLIRQWIAGSKPVSVAAAEKVFSPEDFVAEAGTAQEAVCEGKKIIFLLPFYKTVCPPTSFALMTLVDKMKAGVMQQYNDAYIVHSRNRLATRFLMSDAEESFWFDDDMIPPIGDAAWFARNARLNLTPKAAATNIVQRLRSHGKPFVGGLYVGRNSDRIPMYAEAVADPEEALKTNRAYRDVLKPVTWVGAGAWYVHRSVYAKIQARFPSLAPTTEKGSWQFFSNAETDLIEATDEALKILSDVTATESARISKVVELMKDAKQKAKTQSRKGQGEDVTFCKRAGEAGIQPFVDLGAICAHIGSHPFAPFWAEKKSKA